MRTKTRVQKGEEYTKSVVITDGIFEELTAV
jgi:hypothetical protein